jgi:hypothetical protein
LDRFKEVTGSVEDSYWAMIPATASLEARLPEEPFAELFVQVLGSENAHLPAPQFPIDDFDGESRYIGFALKALNERVAFEINRSDSGPR